MYGTIPPKYIDNRKSRINIKIIETHVCGGASKHEEKVNKYLDLFNPEHVLEVRYIKGMENYFTTSIKCKVWKEV
ncbi:MAG: hypothetical protein ACRCX2_37130 [Paraclostridium sp.]